MKVDIIHSQEEHAAHEESTDSDLGSLIGMTPKEARQYVNDNTANLVAMRKVLKQLAFVVCRLARNQK